MTLGETEGDRDKDMRRKAVKNKIGAKALRQEHTYVLKKEQGTWCR